jgi:hypothetical protein
MNEAVLVGGMAMWVSVVAIVVLGLAGGALMYLCERIAAKSRGSH